MSDYLPNPEEEELARLNREYLDEKTKDAPPPAMPARRKLISGSPLTCCVPVVFMIGIIALIAFYWISSGQSAVPDEAVRRLNELNSVLPQAKEELKKSLEQGEKLYTETETNINNAQEKYEQTKEVIDDVQKLLK